MPSANAPIYTPSIPVSTRNGCYNTRPMAGLLDELKSGRAPFPRPAPVHPSPGPQAVIQVRKWIPLPDPEPLGLGPSVAELTLGRPPRAPRPGDA